MRRFDLEPYLVCNEKYQATDLTIVPPMAIAILTSPLARTRPFLHSIKNVICGAAPLDKEVQTRFRTLLQDGTPFTQVWGMTETSSIATMFTYPEDDDTGSVGRLIPNLEAKYIPPPPPSTLMRHRQLTLQTNRRKRRQHLRI